tara:strand:- start:241 stop:2211 length:1971 start_codon:yes stop_codon:yes gene_type:complete
VKHTLTIFVSLLPFLTLAQTFTNLAPSWNISEYSWDGVYGSGVSAADWNQDGWDDLTYGNTSGNIRTHVNTGATGVMGFTALTLPISQTAESKSIQWVDIDEDGDLDFFYSDIEGRIEILENIGDSTFYNITLETGIPQYNITTEGSSWGDYDNDGDLDLYICRYHESSSDLGVEFRNVLLRNEGGFIFTDVSEESGTDIFFRFSFQSVWYDWDMDGYLDLFVINDKNGANSFFHNLQNGQFEEIASEIGLDVVMDAMTLSLADYNMDGIQDIFITDTGEGDNPSGAKLFQGSPSGQYIEVAAQHGVDLFSWCWGALWMDVDNDTDLDLYVAVHHIVIPYQENYLFENSGAGLSNGEDEGGGGGETPFHLDLFSNDVYEVDLLNAHSVASGDFDRNGWLDFTVHHVHNHKSRIWMNGGFSNAEAPNYIQIGLRGEASNSMGVGSWISVYTGATTQRRTTHCGENFLGQESLYEHFGLGDAEDIDSLKIEWPSGVIDIYLDIESSERHIFDEGHSACLGLEDIITCSTEGLTAMAVTHWEEAEVAWTYQVTDPDGETLPPEYYLGSGDNIDLNELGFGFYTLTVSHDSTQLCTSTFEVEQSHLLGDVNIDGTVGSEDILLLLSEFGCTMGCYIDLNTNNSTGVNDLLLLLSEFGAMC